MLSTLLAAWLCFVAGPIGEFTAQGQQPEVYQIIHRVPIPDVAAMRKALAKADDDLQKGQARLNALRADASKRRENREKIQELAAHVLELSRSARELRAEIRHAPTLLFCVDTVQDRTLVLECDDHRLARAASDLNRGDFVRVLRNSGDPDRITTISRIREPAYWPSPPMDLSFPFEIASVEITASAMFHIADSVQVNVNSKPEPKFRRFVQYPRYRRSIAVRADVWLVDVLGNRREKLLDNISIQSPAKVVSFRSAQQFSRNQVSLELDLLGGNVTYHVDLSRFHEDGRQ